MTRDPYYGRVEWSGREFWLIDTGGLTFDEDTISTDLPPGPTGRGEARDFNDG